MQLLPKWVLTNKYPSIFDSESHTAIEMVAKLYGSMNEMINDYNNFVDETNRAIIEHNESIDKDMDSFRACITEILERYIKSIDIKIDEQDLKIHNAIDYMKNNISEAIMIEFERQLNSGELLITQIYDENTESLNFVVTKG